MTATLEQVNYRLRNKLQECEDALEEETQKRTGLESANKELTAEIRTQKAEYSKFEKHAKDYEKATNKAQKEAKDAKGRADRLISTQKDQLKNAERKYEDAARGLKEWRDKYGHSVEGPADEKHALQMKISEWQSKAEKARNEIVSLEEQIQGSPEQIGLHQALEQWEEHQGCSAGFAELEDKVHDGVMRQQKLESDLTVRKQRYQKARSDIKALQIKVDQLEQTNKTLQHQVKANDFLQQNQQLESDLKASRDQHQKTEEDTKALQGKVHQFEQSNETSRDQEKTDVDMLDDDRLVKGMLESDLKALQERHQQAVSDMIVLQARVDQLEQANKAILDLYESRNDTVQKLELDQQAARDQRREIESNMKALQEHADQLESNLRTAEQQLDITRSNMEIVHHTAEQLELALQIEKEHHETTKSDMETVQETADQLELNLRTTREQYQISKSDMEALQGKVDQLESVLKSTEEQYQTTNSNMETLQEKADQLEQDNRLFQKLENQRLQTETSEDKEQDKNKNSEEDSEKADATPQDIEERVTLIKTQQLQIETLSEAERSQVTPPSSPAYTTDESSQDLEKTPRPKTSLRQDLGYSSEEHSDEQQFDEEQDASAEVSENEDSDDAGEHARGSIRQGKKKLFSTEGKAKNLDTFETRAKERAREQSAVLETLFECTPAKAGVIDRRLKALGPGCLLHEAPAVVAYELSGIPEDTYKGLASGQLIATMPPNEVKDMGTNPHIFAADIATDTVDLPAMEVAEPLFVARDMATDTADLPAEEVLGPLGIANDVATDTAGLPIEEVAAMDNRSRYWDLVFCLLISFIAFSGLFGLYSGLKHEPKPTIPHGILHKHVFSHRHSPFATPLLNASTTPITILYPPRPALQLGMGTMIQRSARGRELQRSKW